MLELYRLWLADSEVAGLLGLMLLTEARRPARITRSGDRTFFDLGVTLANWPSSARLGSACLHIDEGDNLT
jgi:hypothetical protein